jgi:Fe-S-cluster containining protein
MILDCRTCGACCCFRWSWPVLRRDRADAVGIPGEMVRSDLPLMRTVGDRCVALSGVPGVEVACLVYNGRPEACRRFVPGSALCLEARRKLLGEE